MKFYRLDLLTLLISLFILNSCKNQDTIGLGVINSNQVNGSLIDTSTIVINTVPEDSVQTNALGNSALSYFKDPVFGTTESNLAIDLNLPNSSSYVVPTGTITVDSALLVLKYARGSFYGDSIASRYKANVYQLKERVLSQLYYNTKTWSVDKSTLLGSKSFLGKTSDSVQIIRPIANAPDTLVKVSPQLRIPLSIDFINKIFYNAPAGQLKSNLVFKNAVKGLYVTLDQNQTGLGGTVMFALDSAASIQIFYRNNNGTVIDTGVLALPSNTHAVEIKHTRSAAVQTELANTTTGRKTFYIQGLGGLRSKISFPYIKNIIKTIGGDVIVNRAELIVTPVPGSTIPFAPLPKLSLYRLDLAKQRIYLQDGDRFDQRSFQQAILGGFYYPQQQQYHFVITAYIQDLLRGVSQDYGTYIGASVFSQLPTIAPTAEIDGRTQAVGFDTTSPYRIKLNLFYTKVVK
ncbi:MAG: DUF4270 family protein [Bacteroidota bacterium]